MKALILTVLTLVSFNAFAVQDIIQYPNGVQVIAPQGYKGVFIPEHVGKTLVYVEAVKILRPKGDDMSKPKTIECTPKGSLVLGAGTVFCSE